MRVATLFHDGNFLADFVFGTAEVVCDGCMRGMRQILFTELVHSVDLRILALDCLDCLAVIRAGVEEDTGYTTMR